MAARVGRLRVWLEVEPGMELEVRPGVEREVERSPKVLMKNHPWSTREGTPSLPHPTGRDRRIVCIHPRCPGNLDRFLAVSIRFSYPSFSSSSNVIAAATEA